MKFIKKTITKNKLISFFIISFLLVSCNKPKIYFDISKQEVVECNNFKLKDIYIVNDSIDKKGFFIEPRIYLKWNNYKSAPNSIKLNNINKSYQILLEDKVINNFRLMNNTSYTISEAVSGKSTFSIRVWTNNQGKVYKTTHTDCSNSESLDMK